MHNSRMQIPRLMIALLGLTLIVGACAEVQQIAEEEAKRSGNENLAKAISGAGTAISGFMPISYDEERSIGAAMALQVVNRYHGIIEQDQLMKYVNLVGSAVALTCDRPNIPYHFAVLDDPSLNAFATPGGYVFVTQGLLRHIQNEAELAAVLGHEIGHITAKHILEIIQRSKKIEGITKVGLAFYDKNPESFQRLVDTATKKLLDEGLDQEKELEADRLGAIFASRAGYDPTAYLSLLDRLRKLKGDDPNLFKTHPNFSARIENVQQALKDPTVQTTGVLLPERFKDSTGKFL